MRSDHPDSESLTTAGLDRRFLRHRAAPLIIWLVVVSALLVWRQGRVEQFTGVGWVESQERILSPWTDGVVRSLAVDLLDRVEANAVVAIFDDSIVAAELITAEAELGKLRIELRREAASARADLERFFVSEEESRLTYLDELVRAESEAVELDRLDRERERIEALYDQDLASEAEFDEARLRFKTLETARRQRDSLLETARRQLHDSTARRQAQQELTESPARAESMNDVHESLLVQEARISEIQQRRGRLVLRAPVPGQVVRILRRAGETVLAGEPVLALAETENNRVVAFVESAAASNVEVGSVAQLRSLDRPERTATGTVHRVGETLADVPRRLSSNPFATSTALTVLIGELSTEAFLPGERLAIVLRRKQR